MYSVSVCICTYNGSARLPAVLSALAQQDAPSPEWEVLVVDNASTDGTGELAAGLLTETFGSRGRAVREETPGLAFARRRAAEDAAGEIVAFLDDDNIPDPGFVRAVRAAFQERPRAGLVGGKVLPDWECEPTPLVVAVTDYALAICDRGEAAICYQGPAAGPVGAGLCIRRDLLRQILADSRLARVVPGRKGNVLTGGEDLVLTLFAKRLGWECWYDPRLVIRHRIPAWRMEKEYLLRLYEGIGRGQAATRRLYDWKARCPFTAALLTLKDLGRYLRRRLRGPDAELCRRYPAVAQELHELEQARFLGRAREAMRWRT